MDNKYLLWEVFLSLFLLVKILTILDVYIHTHKTDSFYFRYSTVTNISLPTQFSIFNVLLNTKEVIYPVSASYVNNIDAENNV
jgi:hypothetical protein